MKENLTSFRSNIMYAWNVWKEASAWNSVGKAQLGSAPALELARASFLAPALKPELIQSAPEWL